MTNFAFLSPVAKDLIGAINVEGKSRWIVTSAAIAKCLADRVAIPTVAVENIETYYRTVVEMEVLKHLSALNEHIVLEVDTIKELAKRFFFFRYSVAVPEPKVFCLNESRALSDFFTFGRYIDQETLTEISKFPKHLTKVYNTTSDLIVEFSSREM